MNFSAEGRSSISINGLRLAASAARPEVSTAEVRRKLRRDIPESPQLQSWFEVEQALIMICEKPPQELAAMDAGRERVAARGIGASAGCGRRHSPGV